jgi:hypothetical protein
MRLSSLAGSRGYMLGLVFAFVVSLSALGFGLFVDDYLFIASLEGKNPIGSPFDLYCFGAGDAELNRPLIQNGPYPWFGDLDFKAHFFRPLSCALMTLDHKLFGHYALAYNAHSALWYMLLALSAMLVFRRILPPAVGVLALLLFVVDESHVLPAVWWANRHSLIAVSMGLLGVAAHLRWREDNWRAGLPLSLLAFTVALSAAEMGLCTLAYVLAYEVFGRRDSIQQRILSVLPAAMLSIIYLLFYRAGGYGAQFSDIYIDPVGDPVAFLTAAPGRFAMLLGAQFFMLPVEATIVRSELEPLFIVIGCIELLLLTFILYKLWPRFEEKERQALRWLIPGAAMATIPTLAAIVNSRVLMAASAGGAAIIATIIVCLWRELRKQGLSQANDQRKRDWTVPAFAYRAVMSILLWGLIAGHLIIATLAWPAQVTALHVVMNKLNHLIRTSELDESRIVDSQVVVFNPPDPYTGLYQLMLRSFDGKAVPRSWWTISFAPFSHRITRTGEREMEVEVIDGQMMTSIMERLFRTSKKPLPPGYEMDLKGLQVTVLEVGDVGPIRLKLAFEEPPESDRYQILVFRDGAYRRLEIPRIGENVELPHGFL